MDHMMPIMNNGVCWFLADTKACTLIGWPLRVVALLLGLKHHTCKRVGRAHLFARGRYFHIDNLLSARLAFQTWTGQRKRETTT